MTVGGGLSVWHSAAAAQIALAAVILLVIAFAPPIHGRTLLIPISGKAINPDLLQPLMLTPIGTGPLPGSVVVDGKGRELARPLLNEGILMLAAPSAVCRVQDERGLEA